MYRARNRFLLPFFAFSLLFASSSHAEWVEWVGDASLEAKYRFNINFSEFDFASEEDWVLEGRASYGRFYQVLESSRVGVIGHVTGLAHERFDKLNGILTGVDLIGIHKFGLGPTAPVARLRFTWEDLNIRDRMRDGQRHESAISFSKRFTERLGGNVGVSHSVRDGHRGAASGIAGMDTNVFDQQQVIWQIGANYLLTERMLGEISYGHLTGEFDTQCPNAGIVGLAALNPELEAAALDTVFGGRCTYRADGKVDIYDVGLSYFLTETSSLDFGWSLRSGRAGSLDYTSYDLRLGLSWIF